jgi:hypothetical protein
MDCFVAFAPRDDEFDPIGFRAIVLLADLPPWQVKFLHSGCGKLRLSGRRNLTKSQGGY